ncbi:MAG: acetyl-CoA carboxylase biotin carboxyl carrier protein [Actinophytocola sp.]|nr:acetyl-CoA carboxylase biotin carboxyl carrier protein [Actinophytocola sp.]
MELTHEDVLNILELLEGSDVEYLELAAGGTKLIADRNGAGPGIRTATGERPSAEPPPVAAPDSEDVATQPESPQVGPGLVTVTAPVVGVFYRSPEPGAPPFTEVGESVAEDSTVGLVEVMKMFNGVTAGASGRVTEIFAENGAFVEFGEPLLTIRPESAA